jgi:hypothetical protein
MLAPFRVFDGTLATPGIAFTNEISLGIYRPSLGVMAFVSGGLEAFQVTPNGLVSLTRLEHHGVDIYKALGFISWKAVNEGGVWTLVPSASVDGEDWDVPHAIRLTGAGTLQLPGSLTIAGTLNVAGAVTFGLVNLATLNVSGNATVAGNLGAATVTADKVTTKAVVQTALVQNITGAYTADFNTAQSQILTLTGAATITPANVPIGSILRMVLKATNLGVTWSSLIKWPLGAAAPDLTLGPLRKAIVVLENDGTDYLATSAAH